MVIVILYYSDYFLSGVFPPHINGHTAARGASNVPFEHIDFPLLNVTGDQTLIRPGTKTLPFVFPPATIRLFKGPQYSIPVFCLPGGRAV